MPTVVVTALALLAAARLLAPNGKTYVGSIAANTRAIVKGLSGGDATCSIDA